MAIGSSSAAQRAARSRSYDRRAGPPRPATTPSSACSGLLTPSRISSTATIARNTTGGPRVAGDVERRLAPAQHEHGSHRRRDEHHGDEDEVGDDGVERAERDEHGRQHRLRRDRPGRRAESRMHRGRTGREQAVLRHGDVQPRRDHLHRAEAAEHAHDHDRARRPRPPPGPTMASPTWAMKACPSATCPIGITYDERQRGRRVDERHDRQPEPQRPRQRARGIADFAGDLGDLPPAAEREERRRRTRPRRRRRAAARPA